MKEKRERGEYGVLRRREKNVKRAPAFLQSFTFYAIENARVIRNQVGIVPPSWALSSIVLFQN